MCNFKTRLEARGYPKSLINNTKSEVYAFCDNISSRGKKPKTNTDDPKSATAENNLQNTSISKSYKRGKSLEATCSLEQNSRQRLSCRYCKTT